MSVTEIKEALGAWSLTLRPDTPREILDAIAPFGHIAVMPGRVDVRTAGDGLLTEARYVGVVRSENADETGTTELAGAGMAFWLGDEDGKGPVWLTAKTFSASTFANTVRSLLPNSGAVIEGTLYAASGSYTGSHIYETPRTSITYVTDTFSTTQNPVSWRVNGNATLDAGPDSSLFVTVPKAVLVRKQDAGRDMFLQGLAGQMALGTDVEDYTTKVVLLAEGEGSATVTAQASIIPPYLDRWGNLISMTRLVSEFETDATNAVARAQLQLNRFINPRFSVNLSTDEYDIKGTFAVGDTIYVFDPDIGFQDTAQEVMFRGQVLNPKALTVSEMTWPVAAGWTVAFRDQTGNWYDLSDYYQPEGGATTVVVGEFSRAINDSTSQPVGSRPVGDSSIPAIPVFGATSTSSYQTGANGSGLTFAQVQLSWTPPLNTDGSTILDGNHYEIRYRVTGSTITTSWDQASVPWGTTVFLITGLIPGTSYDFQIQAVDGAIPPNLSGWSSTLAVVTSADAIAPSTPAAPSVAASRIAVQVTHTLGKSSGGTYNLEADLDRLEVHAGASASFTPSNSTLIGKLPATIANIRGSIPAVGTFNVESTAATWIKVTAVDTSGNMSGASTAASATALLIDTAHISDLTVSKVTAGTIGATWIQGGTITTASSGARVELAASGLNAYNSSGSATVVIKGSDGSATVTGKFRTGFPGAGSPYLLMQDSGDRTTLTFYNAAEDKPAFMNTPVDGSDSCRVGINSGTFPYSTAASSSRHRLFLNNAAGIQLETYRVSTGLGDIGGKLFLSDVGSGIYTYSEAGTGTQTGGQLYMNKDQAILSRQGGGVYSGGRFASFLDSSKIGVYNTGVLASELALFDDQSIWITGKFSANNAIGGVSALYCGTWNVGAATTFAVSYGVTMGTRPQVLYSIHSGSNQGVDRLTIFNTTGFTMTQGNSVAINLNYWAFRTL